MIHAGDTGTELIMTLKDDGTVVDVSSATTTKNFKIIGPDDTTVSTVAASFTTDGTDGKIEYTTLAATFATAGDYSIQAYIVMTGWTGHSEKVPFKVLPVAS